MARGIKYPCFLRTGHSFMYIFMVLVDRVDGHLFTWNEDSHSNLRTPSSREKSL